MRFTAEQIRMLAAVERQMDAGEIPFVVLAGKRAAVHPATMEHFGLEIGQTISNEVGLAMVIGPDFLEEVRDGR